MAKRNIRKTDPETTTTPEPRRRTTAADGTEITPKAPRSRRKIASAATAVEGAAVQTPETEELTTADEIASPFSATPEVPHEHIAVRAYHIYLSRGARPGDQVADWITAERQLRDEIQAVR